MPPCSLIRLAAYVQKLHSGCHAHYNALLKMQMAEADRAMFISQQPRAAGLCRVQTARNTTASISSNAT